MGPAGRAAAALGFPPASIPPPGEKQFESQNPGRIVCRRGEGERIRRRLLQEE